MSDRRKNNPNPRLALAAQLPTKLKPLAALAYNLRWSWDPEAPRMWAEIASRCRRRRREGPLNPVELLLDASQEQLETLGRDRAFLELMRGVQQRLRRPVTARGEQIPWGKIGRTRPVVYLSMEFAIDACIPMYSGGLGVLAGDHFKSASDLGLPLVGIGLAYRRGYYRQQLDRSGKLRILYPRVDPERLPLEELRRPDGGVLRVSVDLPGRGRPRRVLLRVWKMQLGSVPIYLLDSDVRENRARDRSITNALYGGDREKRIAQEVLLGIGGARLLKALGLKPSVWHLNEGHVAFCTMERLRDLFGAGRKSAVLSFDEAVEVVAANTVFTTHTPVPAGNEVFDLQLARRYLEPQCKGSGFSVDDYLNAGVDRSAGGRPCFSMTVLAMRLSRFRNGVSRLHGVVAREMWQHLWPGFSATDLPVRAITNGVHAATWTSSRMDALFRARVDENWRDKLNQPEVWKPLLDAPDRDVWQRRNELRRELVDFVRSRCAASMRREGCTEREISRRTSSLLDPSALTIGFARRFALYKRAALLFHDMRRAKKIFANKKRPLQIVFAGKPHPQDEGGIELFERISRIARLREFAGKVVLLENYDMDVGRALVQGVDVWLNNPRRPLEASGTSGQKVPFNGGLNLSVLDGWWDEAYREGLGWAIGGRDEQGEPVEQDREDSRALYALLEREIVPLFYQRSTGGVPRGWTKMVKASMAELIPQFNTHRMVEEYRDLFYGPARAQGECIRAGGYRMARDIVAWRARVASNWPLAHVRDVRWAGQNGKSMVEVDVFLAGLSGADIDTRLSVGEKSFLSSGRARARDGGVYRYRFILPRSRVRPIKIRFWPYHTGLIHTAEIGLSIEESL